MNQLGNVTVTTIEAVVNWAQSPQGTKFLKLVALHAGKTAMENVDWPWKKK